MPDYQMLINIIGIMSLVTLVILEMFDTKMDEREAEQEEHYEMSISV
jgi:hypothetical protein